MKRRGILGFLGLLAFLILLSGCGSKGPDQVASDLEKKMKELKSYMAAGTLTLQTGGGAQTYKVEVWHKRPEFFRIALTNVEKSVKQIILKNQEGVFVLTPHLNKSFRFQSNWPDRQGQVYLFESLVNSITNDAERNFAKEEDAYVFQVKANYQNRTLSHQRIWFDAKTLAPKKVEVMDPDYKVLVSLTFDDFRFDTKFDDNAFDTQHNMTGSSLSDLPAMSYEEKADFNVIEPGYLPAGVKATGTEEVENEEGKKVIFQYGGEYQYTMIEEPVKEKTVIASSGDPVDLGFVMGVKTVSGNVKTLRFTYNGVDFTLMTANLPDEEMVNVAKSVFEQTGK